MKPSNVINLNKTLAHQQLIVLLQNAHAGELAAACAYWGHSHSLFLINKKEKSELLKIYQDELHHRKELKKMLAQLGAQPRAARELLMATIGSVIGFLCLWGGWFIPMYGAGKLESTNIAEYEVAARLAWISGNTDMSNELLEFAEIEWDHESYFYEKSSQHFLFPYYPKWTRPSDKKNIRDMFNDFQQNNITPPTTH